MARVLTPKFNSEVTNTIIAYLEEGAFLHVAAEAAGVGDSTLEGWIARGKNSPEGDPYHDFYMEVMSARAGARAKAEARVYKENALAWLMYGPGKSKPNSEGWSRSMEVTGTQTVEVRIQTQWGGGQLEQPSGETKQATVVDSQPPVLAIDERSSLT